MSELVKKCPSCGHLNPEWEVFCINPSCGGTDLSRVSVHSFSSHGAESSPPPAEVKICPACGGENESFALLCTHNGCGAQLEGIALHTRETAARPGASAKQAAKLWLIVGNQSFECRHGDILGRSGTLACHVFEGIGTVSGEHVAVELRDDNWELLNLPPRPGRPGKNMTALDGTELALGASARLTGEHVLKLSTQCEVRLRVVAAGP